MTPIDDLPTTDMHERHFTLGLELGFKASYKFV